MKISGTSNQLPDFPRQKKVRDKHSAVSASSATAASNQVEEVEFSATFFNAVASRVRRSLDELLKEVQAQGERLARVQNFQELEKYRELVRQFLDKIVKDLYRLKPSSSLGPKVQVILEKVDAELDHVASELRSGQSAQLLILEKVGRIKGLLLDAYQ